MLLPPQGNQRGLGPMAKHTQAMHPRMAGRAERNQESTLVDPGAAMVNRELAATATNTAAAAVAIQNGLTLSGEPQSRMGLAVVAAGAEAGRVETVGTTGAEKPGLPARRSGTRRGYGQARGEESGSWRCAVQTMSIADGNGDYHLLFSDPYSSQK